MTMPARTANRPATRTQVSNVLHSSQRGVVLIISLILLVVISLLAVTSMRNAGSSESVASNVRRTELATEAAEIALRFCEEHVVKVMSTSPPPATTPTLPTTPATPIILAPTDPPKWQDKSTSTGWDSKDSPAAVSAPLLDSKVNPAGIAKTYQRPPECMIEMQFPPGGISTNLTRTSSFVITARGFGPEVLPADSARSRPQGSEAWLQSHIQIQ